MRASVNRQYILTSRPKGVPTPEEVCLVESLFRTAISRWTLPFVAGCAMCPTTSSPSRWEPKYGRPVGGDMLDAVLLNLAHRARLVFCGWIATYNDSEQRPGPKNLWQLLAKSARFEGFVVKDYVEDFPVGIAAMGQWLAEGKIVYKEQVVDGLENALDAFHMLFDGSNTGKLMVKISE